MDLEYDELCHSCCSALKIRWPGSKQLAREVYKLCLGTLTYERRLGIMSNISIAETIWGFKLGRDR